MRQQPCDYQGSLRNMEDEDAHSMDYHMHNPYNPGRLMRWLTNFDDLQDEEAAILPQFSLPKIPARTQLSRRPESFREINLSDKSQISDEMRDRMEAGVNAQQLENWIKQWGLRLARVKKRQHRSNLLKNGHNSTTQKSVCPTTHRTKKARTFRALIASKLLSSRSIGLFMKLPVRQRLAKYREVLEAPGMINISDPATITTDLQTHCIASIADKHARSLLEPSAIAFLPSNWVEVWREAQRHFWRNNVFVINATQIKAVLNGFNARIKSYIGMLHIDLEILDDMDNLAYHNSSHDDVTNNQSLQNIRQQNQDLRRLIQECYNLTWVRIHVHTEWMEGEIHDLVQAHRSCRVSRCRHIRKYKELCMNTQRRVEHLTWLFYKSLKCKVGTVFIDVEQLGLDGVMRISEVKIDHKKLDEVDGKMRAVWKEQTNKEKKERKDGLRAPAVKKVEIEVIDLT